RVPSPESRVPAAKPRMSIVVQKYGGSSVADVARLRQVAERVMRTRAAGHEVVVVVSAMGDTTDELLALAKQVSPNPDRRELDMLLTAGERISMALLSMAIRELGGDAISFTGSQSGIITNDRHVDARIIEVRPVRVQDELARGKIVVIAGYQGVSYRREVTTLGRGGSDTTAVAMAGALEGVRLGRNASAPADELLRLLDERAVAGKQLHQAFDGALTLVISRENLHDEERVRAMLSDQFGTRATLRDDLGAVSVVGAG